MRRQRPRVPHRDVPRAVVDREAKEALHEVRDLPGFTRADRRYLRGVGRTGTTRSTRG
jgi:hypothetical protein